MFLSDGDLLELTALRRALHALPERSGEEAGTARTVAHALSVTGADRIVTGLGGHGVAAVYGGAAAGPTVMFRAELDGLPIEELGDLPHHSQVRGRAHACGHDGHMATLLALARGLGRERPARGRVVLLFQPAEENGAGAAAVLADARFQEVVPDWAFALHNLPGLPLGHVELRTGPVNCASRGMRVTLTGKTAHASMPEQGTAPTGALARLLPGLTMLGPGGPLSDEYALVTVTHARLGEPAFGIAPGRAEVWATLRTLTDAHMARLCAAAETLCTGVAQESGLQITIGYEDVFVHCENQPEAVAVLRGALDAEGVPHTEGEPMRASEDFGRFGQHARAAMFFLGAGERHPSLHHPDYDFPDELIPLGAAVFMRTVRSLLG